MAKSWAIYVTLWTTESDDVERKLRLHNVANKRLRHGYESQTSSTGGGVRERKAGWRFEMFEDTKIATWWSDEARRMPQDVRRTRGLRPKMIDCIRILRVVSSRSGSLAKRTSTTAGHVVTVQVTDLDVWSFETAVRWTSMFCLVELARQSMIWYILVWILASGCSRSDIFSPCGKWSCETLGCLQLSLYWKLKHKKAKIVGVAVFQWPTYRRD